MQSTHSYVCFDDLNSTGKSMLAQNSMKNSRATASTWSHFQLSVISLSNKKRGNSQKQLYYVEIATT